MNSTFRNFASMYLMFVFAFFVLPGLASPAWGSPSQVKAASALSGYFVSPNGNDANPGTEASPWRTLRKAAQTVTAGSTVYVRAGTYGEQINIRASGTQSAPIQFLAYPGETPVIEGNLVSMANWGALVQLSGSYITISGFEIRNSKYLAVYSPGAHNTVDRCYTHHNQENGILLTGDYDAATNNRVYRNVLSNELSKKGYWSGGLQAARDQVDGLTEFVVMRNNEVWENWGEGLSTFEANGTIIENNIVHDNYSTNLYISDATNVTVNRNLVYMNPSSYINGHGANVGIMMGDEQYKPPSANIKVTNNIVYGTRRNFYWWQGNQGGAMKNVLIANNTFVNSIYGAGVIIAQAAHVNVRFENNIVQQDNALPVISASTNVTYATNLWSKNPASTAVGQGDYVGDPRLSKSGSPFAPAWYQPLDGSRSVDTARPLSEVTVDYFGNLRSSAPDKGAIEKSGTGGPTAVVPTATATRGPATATPVVPTPTKAVTATAKPPEVLPTATVPSWPPRQYRIMIPIVVK